jgi:hypothetical protein
VIEEVFTDYRPLDVQSPTRRRFAGAGSRFWSGVSPFIKINAPIDPALFKRRRLDRAPHAVVRRAVRRFVCQCADTRASELDPTVTVSGLGGPQFSAAGGTLVRTIVI